MKDNLKGRGYRWSDGRDGHPKYWRIELVEDALDEELRYLRSEISLAGGRSADQAVDCLRSLRGPMS